MEDDSEGGISTLKNSNGSNPLKIFLNSIFLKFETLTLGMKNRSG